MTGDELAVDSIGGGDDSDAGGRSTETAEKSAWVDADSVGGDSPNGAGSGVLSGTVGSLLKAPSLAWELHTDCPLWERAEPSDDHANADDWSVVEVPTVPTPSSQPEELQQYEASLRQGGVLAGTSPPVPGFVRGARPRLSTV